MQRTILSDIPPPQLFFVPCRVGQEDPLKAHSELGSRHGMLPNWARLDNQGEKKKMRCCNDLDSIGGYCIVRFSVMGQGLSLMAICN